MRKAIVIGIDKYPSAPLSGCINDAEALAVCLKQPGFDFVTDLLIDEHATRRAVKAAIERVLSGATYSLIYFAGHGWKTNVTTYLVTHDTEEGDEGIDVSYLATAVTRLTTPEQTVVIVLDCCHSGNARPRNWLQTVRAMTADDIPSVQGTGRVVLAACRGDEGALELTENGRTHGLFTAHLIKALKGECADSAGVITVSACFEYVARRMTPGGGQVPVLRGDQTGRIAIGTLIRTNPVAVVEQSTLPRYTLTQINEEAKNYVEKMFSTTQSYTHDDWLARGHREACQRLVPILDWFRRRLSDSKELSTNREFQQYWNNIAQQYQQLCSLTTGTMLEQGRRIEGVLGSGTFGTVWRASDGSSDSAMCFKAYHANDLREKDKVGRFLRGYNAMKQLDHPNIVKVLDYSEVPLGFYMRFIDGPNFRQLSPSSAIDADQIVELLLRIAETLQHAHSREVLHRDVKPENVILAHDSKRGIYQPYLTDFDLAWFTSATQLTKAAEGFGSHFYAAPEQMNNPSSAVAHRSTVDAYSFGQLMFYGLCGRDPAAFDQAVNHTILSKVLSNKVPNENAAKMLLSLYDRCTMRAPEKREGVFRNVCDELSNALTDLRHVKEKWTAQDVLAELRYSIAGLTDDQAGVSSSSAGFVDFRSQSNRTTVIVRVKLENEDIVALEATFIPDQLVLEGLSAEEARHKVNTRIDAALSEYQKAHSPKRTPGKSGPYQTAIAFSGISKNTSGLSKARAMIARVIDCVERT